MNEFKISGTVSFVKKFEKVTSFGVSIPKDRGFNFVNLKTFLPIPFEKGSFVNIKGHFQSGSYMKNGEKIFTHDIIADEISVGSNE